MDIKYFDNAATTALDKDILDKMIPFFTENFYNPSAIYKPSMIVREAIDEARGKVAKVLNAKDNEIYFTSGSSESNNMALKGFALANKNKGNHIITTCVEHSAILNGCKSLENEGFEVTYLGVDEYGLINLEELESSITDKTILISVMSANNEIGTVLPIREIGRIAHEHGVVFHTDATQSMGVVKIDVEEDNIDMLSMSGHKFYGPKGIGVLYVRKGTKMKKITDGGHQENGIRSGTENVPGIVGLGYAIEKAYLNLEENNKRITELRDYYISEIEKRIPHVILNGHRTLRLPGNANFSFKYIEGESILLLLDRRGICVSTGSACSSKTLEPSHVLISIGLPHEFAHGSIRVSIGKHNTKEEVDYLIDAMEEVVTKLRNMSPLYEEVK